MTQFQTFNCIDLYSGVGGFTLGFLDYSNYPEGRFRPRLLVDIDADAAGTFHRNLPKVPFVTADISKLSGADIRAHAGMREDEELHVLIGGPPCQGFSFLGKRSLEDTRNNCVLDFLRLVKELRPSVVVMENVPLIITSHDGAVIKEISSALSSFSYNCTADVLQASDYGVPQLRKRAFVVAYHSSLDVFPSLPARSHERVKFAAEILALDSKPRFEPEKKPFVSVEEAIGDLPLVGAGEGREVMQYSTPAQNDYQKWCRAGSQAVFNHKARIHSASFLNKISVIKEGSRNQELPDDLRFSDNYFSQAYARLLRHGISQTITTSFGNPGSGRFTHYNELRSITVREAARFQSFPDVFAFEGYLVTQMRHVGNAVPPLLARALRDQVARDLVIASNQKPHGQKIQQVQAAPAKDDRSGTQRSATMRAVPSKNTSIEVLLRNALWEAGHTGYRLHGKSIPGTPDIYFKDARIAVFIDGCFWHGCPKCYRAPQSNSTYWEMKVARNKARDAAVNAELAATGWTGLRMWEHEVKSRPASCVAKIAKTLAKAEAAKKRAGRKRAA